MHVLGTESRNLISKHHKVYTLRTQNRKHNHKNKITKNYIVWPIQKTTTGHNDKDSLYEDKFIRRDPSLYLPL